ncbi:MAG TPA: MBL fold metallo-hydrolase [Chlamydiales bacterium]|nr:MBL fold metallo-hydrolase [Chlamydiales bacterium]
MKGTFLFLGTAGSAGVPVIGCSCPVCVSSSPFNQRFRPSGLIKINGKTLLIDVGPDFRIQALTHKIKTLDGLLLTHTHYDHIAGIDELRIFYLRSQMKLPCLLSQESLDDLEKRYDYLFQPIGKVPTLSAQLDIHVLPEDEGEKEFLGLKIGYVSYTQGGCKVNGYRFGNFAYISDIREFNPSIFEKLQGIETLVVSALREESSMLHFSLPEAIDFANQVGAKQTWITHISHGLDHESTNRKLPKSIQLGYDGLELGFNV